MKTLQRTIGLLTGLLVAGATLLPAQAADQPAVPSGDQNSTPNIRYGKPGDVGVPSGGRPVRKPGSMTSAVDPGPYRVFQWISINGGPFERYCLDSNRAGHVYVLKCTYNENNNQRWWLWSTGWARNVNSNNCLVLLPGWNLGTTPGCADNVYQFWTQWSGGWFQNSFDFACVTYPSPFSSDVVANRCADRPQQFWIEQKF